MCKKQSLISLIKFPSAAEEKKNPCLPSNMNMPSLKCQTCIKFLDHATMIAHIGQLMDVIPIHQGSVMNLLPHRRHHGVQDLQQHLLQHLQRRMMIQHHRGIPCAKSFKISAKNFERYCIFQKYNITIKIGILLFLNICTPTAFDEDIFLIIENLNLKLYTDIFSFQRHYGRNEIEKTT